MTISAINRVLRWVSSPGAPEEGEEHPQQADSGEVRAAGEAADGADGAERRQRGEAQRRRGADLREGHRRARLLFDVRQPVPLPGEGEDAFSIGLRGQKGRIDEKYCNFFDLNVCFLAVCFFF